MHAVLSHQIADRQVICDLDKLNVAERGERHFLERRSIDLLESLPANGHYLACGSWLLHPVLHLQSLDAFEFALVVGHKNQPFSTGMRSDPQVVGTNGSAGPLQC